MEISNNLSTRLHLPRTVVDTLVKCAQFAIGVALVLVLADVALTAEVDLVQTGTPVELIPQ
jgi:hypothetical protein